MGILYYLDDNKNEYKSVRLRQMYYTYNHMTYVSKLSPR